MKLISISTDRKIFEPDSAVLGRIRDYGTLFEELHVIVFSLKRLGHKKKQLGKNIWIYPTNSYFKLFYIIDAFFIARKLRRGAVVSVQDPFETGIVGWLLKKVYGLKLNVQVHTDISSPYFVKKHKIRSYLAPRIIKEADSVRTVSKRIKVPGEKVTVLPVYIDKGGDGQFHDLARKEGTVLAVSRLTEEKNLFFLVDVFAEVLETKSNTNLVIVGEGPLKKDLSNYLKSRGLDKSIELAGWRNDLSKFYQEASLLIHTSLYEGYGMVFIEAGLWHVPIVSSNVGIMGEVLENEKSAAVCSVGDKACFVKKVLELLENKEKAQRMADIAYENIINHLPVSKEEYLRKYRESI